MEVISFLSNKGGVGKTTLCCNIGQALAISGKKVLCIDNDNQHSLSNRLQVTIGPMTIKQLYRDYNDSADYVPFLEKAVTVTAIPRLHCISAAFNLMNADVKSLKALKDLINKSEIAEYYDFVVIDNHPGLDLLQQVSILASTRFIIPVFLKQQSVEGVPELIRFLHRLTIPNSAISIIPNHYEGLKSEALLLDQVKTAFPKNVSPICIPKDRMIEEVEMQGRILFLDRLLSSRSVPFLIKLITQLFPSEYDESALTRTLTQRRSQYKGRRILANLEKPSSDEQPPTAPADAPQPVQEVAT